MDKDDQSAINGGEWLTECGTVKQYSPRKVGLRSHQPSTLGLTKSKEERQRLIPAADSQNSREWKQTNYTAVHTSSLTTKYQFYLIAPSLQTPQTHIAEE